MNYDDMLPDVLLCQLWSLNHTHQSYFHHDVKRRREQHWKRDDKSKTLEKGDLIGLRYLMKECEFPHDNPWLINRVCKLGYLDIVKYFIEELKWDYYGWKVDGFFWASVMGHLPIVQYFIEEQGIDMYLQDHYSQDGLDVILYALKLGYLPIVQYLVETRNFDIHRHSKMRILKSMRSANSHGHQDVVNYVQSLLDKPPE